MKRIREYVLVAFYIDLFMLCLLYTNTTAVPVTSTTVREAKKVAITFDDGPNARYTSQLLSELAKRDVVASFFVTGEHAKESEAIIEEMAEAGHLIGNHTYTHMTLTSENVGLFKEELLNTSEVIRTITGKGTEYVRPPYGLWQSVLEEELDMIPVFWSVDPLDWCKSDAYEVARFVLNEVEENDIILMHDASRSSVEAAMMIVDALLEQGYQFVTVDEIVMD